MSNSFHFLVAYSSAISFWDLPLLSIISQSSMNTPAMLQEVKKIRVGSKPCLFRDENMIRNAEKCANMSLECWKMCKNDLRLVGNKLRMRKKAEK